MSLYSEAEIKGLLLAIIITIIAPIVIVFTGVAQAFHAGGAGDCDGCHSMHNSFDGSANVTGGTFARGTGSYLLKASDQSSVCLNCHQAADTVPSGYHISTSGVQPYDQTVPVEMTPGGDFAWLKKTMNITVGGTAIPDGNNGDRHGHNITAQDYNYYSDSTSTLAPGSTNPYPSANLACSSCHDPHGKYRRFANGTVDVTGLPVFDSGSYSDSAPPTDKSAVGVYRLLGGVGYSPKSLGGSYFFRYPSPIAVVARSYNRSEDTSQTGIAYGSGMSEWCANCHDLMLRDLYDYTPGQRHPHPASNKAKLSAAIVSNYNAFISSGVVTNTNAAASFSTLAPFELGLSDVAAMRFYAVTSTSYTDQNMPAANITSNVMCLSCHRAHASGFQGMMRFSAQGDFMTVADGAGNAIYDSSTTDNKINFGYTQQQQQNAYYGRPATMFGPFARIYCNKCHAQN